MSFNTSGSFPKGLRPGLADIFNMQTRKDKQYHLDLFTKVTSDKQYEERMGYVGAGVATVKNEGAPVKFTETYQGYIRRTENIVTAIGMNVTMEAIKNNLYPQIYANTKSLAHSLYLAKQIRAANIINSGYSSGVTYLDGQPLFSTGHVRKGGGTYSNRLAAGIDLSELALETIFANAQANRDERGNLDPLMLDKLFVPASLYHQALRLTKSDNQAETANNAVNAIRMNGTLPGGVAMNPFFSDADAFFVTTDIQSEHGFIYQEREPTTFDQDKDSTTFNAMFIGYDWYNLDVVDVRCAYGSPGL